MKHSTKVLLLFLMLFSAGCVTEGALQSGPESPQAAAEDNLQLGIRYLQNDQPEIAVDRLLRALEYQPRMADAHSTIAVAYDQLREFELAETHHARATELAPTNPVSHNAFAVFLCRQNRWAEAEPLFRAAIANARSADPRDWMFNAATCARSAGDREGEERYLREVLAFDPIDAAALRGMVDLSIRAENFFQGRGFWQRLEQSAPAQPVDLLSCYIIESRLGDDAAAGRCAVRLANEFPESPAQSQLRQLMAVNGG